MSDGIPMALSHAISKVQGVSVNSFNVTPTSGSSATPAGGQIRIQLPTNSLCDMKTSKLHFSVTTTGLTTRLPVGVKTLFERVQVLAGGVTIYQGNNFFGIQEYAYSVAKDKPYDYVNDHGFVATTYGTDGSQLGTSGETYSTSALGSETLYSMDLGEMSEVSPRILDLSIMPQLEVVFFVAPSTVLSVPSAATDVTNFTTSHVNTNASFSITNPVFIANCYAMSDGMYSTAMQQRISDLGYLELVFPQTISFNQSWHGSCRQSLGAMSLDRLHAVFRPSGFATRKAPVLVSGYAHDTVSAGPVYSYHGGDMVDAQGNHEYQSAFQQMKAPTLSSTQSLDDVGNYSTASPLRFQFKVNSASVPQFQPNQSQWLELTRWANNSKLSSVTSLPEYLNNKFVMSYPFNLPTNFWERPCVSGFDSRSSNTFIELISQNSSSGSDCLVLAETSTILRVGSGKQIELLM